jgi:chemotaxis protein histidine kinase CheA
MPDLTATELIKLLFCSNEGHFGYEPGDRSQGLTYCPQWQQLSQNDKQLVMEVCHGNRPYALLPFKNDLLLFEHKEGGVVSREHNKRIGYQLYRYPLDKYKCSGVVENLSQQLSAQLEAQHQQQQTLVENLSQQLLAQLEAQSQQQQALVLNQHQQVLTELKEQRQQQTLVQTQDEQILTELKEQRQQQTLMQTQDKQLLTELKEQRQQQALMQTQDEQLLTELKEQRQQQTLMQTQHEQVLTELKEQRQQQQALENQYQQVLAQLKEQRQQQTLENNINQPILAEQNLQQTHNKRHGILQFLTLSLLMGAFVTVLYITYFNKDDSTDTQTSVSTSEQSVHKNNQEKNAAEQTTSTDDEANSNPTQSEKITLDCTTQAKNQCFVEETDNLISARGQDQLTDGKATIKLPNWKDSMKLQGYTVQLTAKGDKPYSLSYTDTHIKEKGEFQVYGEPSCLFFSWFCRKAEFSWEVKAKKVQEENAAEQTTSTYDKDNPNQSN